MSIVEIADVVAVLAPLGRLEERVDGVGEQGVRHRMGVAAWNLHNELPRLDGADDLSGRTPE